MSYKFKITITDIDEKMLGPILGALPNGIQPEIMRISSGPAKVTTPSVAGAGLAGLDRVAKCIAQMPSPFDTKNLVPVMVHAGFNESSTSYVLRVAKQQGLIKKVPGLGGNATKYERVK